MCNENDLLKEGVDYPLVCADWTEADFDDEATLAAKEAFGIKFLFPWQRIVIANIMDAVRAGNDEMEQSELNDSVCKGRQIVLLPTGAGKSLCFLTPALLLDGPTLVIYPLLALMSDQKRRMDAGHLEAVEFRGGQSAEEREENFRRINEGAKIILANPEVLQNAGLLSRLCTCGIKHIAIDEAHCVSEWGDSFRPAYLTLGEMIRKINPPVVTAFTATASFTVLQRVSEVLFGGEAHIVRSDSDRPNIHYTVVNAYAKKRAAVRLALTEQKPMLIFCGTRKNAEDMARELSVCCGRGKVRFYHAGLSREEKKDTEKWFHGKTDAIMAVTCAYGMGVDKQDVRTVIHYAPPPNVESYIQEAGRAARDGKIGNAFLIWGPDDSHRFSLYPKGSRQRAVFDFAESQTCRRQVLLDALNGEQAVCDGCDVCERGKPADFADDASFVQDFVLRNRKCMDREELCENLLENLNRRDVLRFGMRIWEENDVVELFTSMMKEKYLRMCLWPWFRKIDCGTRKSGVPQKISRKYLSKRWRRMAFWENRTASFLKKIRQGPLESLFG
jgi:ATP-dependent DNA helicase RecQ